MSTNSNDDSTTLPGASPFERRRPHLVVVDGPPTEADIDACLDLLKNPHREPAD